MNWDRRKQLRDTENAIISGSLDFAASYMAVANVEYDIRDNPELASDKTVHALEGIIDRQVHASQRQSYFLYRKAAGTLLSIASTRRHDDTADMAVQSLKRLVSSCDGNSHRAAAEALGALPLKIQSPCLPAAIYPPPPAIQWDDLIKKGPIADFRACRWFGRSLVADIGNGKIFILKMARTEEDIEALNTEARWMGHLSVRQESFRGWFDVPIPININDAHVFHMKDAPASLFGKKQTAGYAIGFTAPAGYFAYPNDDDPDHRLEPAAIKDVLERNAWLLGSLAAEGIVHTAPIPLFHNRVQRHRRGDRGLYEWPRAGRLDRWLMSCRYPNIAKTGVRDFEHFESFSGSPRLYYRLIGNHLLSLILIAGSYFRNLAPEQVGLDRDGQPVDVRHLFDPEFLRELIHGIFSMYYEGFTGRPFSETFPVDLSAFVNRLIEEMGVDRHMEEILRVADQLEMSDAELSAFLKERGYTDEQIRKLEKGRADITLYTGPHLGGFNQRISLPELIHFTATAAAWCICDRYRTTVRQSATT